MNTIKEFIAAIRIYSIVTKEKVILLRLLKQQMKMIDVFIEYQNYEFKFDYAKIPFRILSHRISEIKQDFQDTKYKANKYDIKRGAYTGAERKTD